MKKRIHIQRYGEQWSIRKAGNTKVTAVFKTQKEAIVAARKIGVAVIQRKPKAKARSNDLV